MADFITPQYSMVWAHLFLFMLEIFATQISIVQKVLGTLSKKQISYLDPVKGSQFRNWLHRPLYVILHIKFNLMHFRWFIAYGVHAWVFTEKPNYLHHNAATSKYNVLSLILYICKHAITSGKGSNLYPVNTCLGMRQSHGQLTWRVW